MVDIFSRKSFEGLVNFDRFCKASEALFIIISIDIAKPKHVKDNN